jgi:hypothetical protein
MEDGMYWASRTFAPGAWFEAQDRFEELWADAGEPADMMLTYVDTPDFQVRIFVGLPAPADSVAFPEFQPVQEPDLPKRPKLLMGDVDEFKRRFPRAV